jgi:hypothetical protein
MLLVDLGEDTGELLVIRVHLAPALLAFALWFAHEIGRVALLAHRPGWYQSRQMSIARSVAARRSARPSFAGPFTFAVMASRSPASASGEHPQPSQ